MDIQPGVLERVPDHAAYFARLSEAVRVARSHAIRVIHVVVAFRVGLPEVSPKNQSFAALKRMQAEFLIDARPVIAPEGNEVVVTKRRVSAFTGSDLEVILRSAELEHLVLCGFATSGVVLSTLREAADRDYRLTVLEDLCADPDPEVHAVLVSKVFPRQARVIRSPEWAAELAPSSSAPVTG